MRAAGLRPPPLPSRGWRTLRLRRRPHGHTHQTRAGMSPHVSNLSDAAKARLLLVVLCLGWGTAWVTMRMALEQIPPFSMRRRDAVARRARADQLRALSGPHARDRAAGAPGSTSAWRRCSTSSRSACSRRSRSSSAETSRVAIMVYTMPIWAAMLALPILGERLTPTRMVALGALHRRDVDPDRAARRPRHSGRHHARARRRDELGRRHRLPEMGEARRRPDGDHDLAARVRRCRDRGLRAAVRRRARISMPARGRCSG